MEEGCRVIKDDPNVGKLRSPEGGTPCLGQQNAWVWHREIGLIGVARGAKGKVGRQQGLGS